MTQVAVRRILVGVSLFLAAGLAVAQDSQPAPQNPSPGWRRIGDPAPAATMAPGAAQDQQNPEPIARDEEVQTPPAQAEQQPQPQAQPQQQAQPQPQLQQRPDPRMASQQPAYGLPAVLTVKPGTFVTIRVNQPLSSDRNRPGDSFSGTLAQPLVVDGVVVAQRGQTVYGTVAEAEKAHAGSPSRLGLALSEITIADGTQMPISSQLAGFEGGRTPAGQQAGTIAGTTVVGAAIGAMAGRGTGAAIGGGVGAAAGAVAVLLTRNRPTVIYPEAALTFRTEAPLEISTARAPQAFQYVNPNQYNDRPPALQSGAARRYGYPAAPPPGYAPYPHAAPYPYAGWGYPYPYYYPYSYGPSFGVFIGGGRRWR